MLVDVCIKSQGSDPQYFAKSTDLDYWNIRQWRLLWFRYCEAQAQNESKIIIESSNPRPF